MSILIITFNTMLKYVKHLDMHDSIEYFKITSDNIFILRHEKGLIDASKVTTFMN